LALAKSARKTPAEKIAKPSKTRGLRKADREAVFFFIAFFIYFYGACCWPIST
jgi:hypothetical protein